MTHGPLPASTQRGTAYIRVHTDISKLNSADLRVDLECFLLLYINIYTYILTHTRQYSSISPTSQADDVHGLFADTNSILLCL